MLAFPHSCRLNHGGIFCGFVSVSLPFPLAFNRKLILFVVLNQFLLREFNEAQTKTCTFLGKVEKMVKVEEKRVLFVVWEVNACC